MNKSFKVSKVVYIELLRKQWESLITMETMLFKYISVKENCGGSSKRKQRVVDENGKGNIWYLIWRMKEDMTLQLVVLQLAFPLKKILILTWMQKRQEVGKLEY